MTAQTFTFEDGTVIEASGSRSANYLAAMAPQLETTPEETDLEDHQEEEAHESVE